MQRRLDTGPVIGPLEDGVPVPRSRNNCGLRQRMEMMKPGQSFVTALSRNACYGMAKKLGFRVLVRPETESTIRVWRDFA